MIYKDITKEKERRILKRNCYITLLKNLFPVLRREKKKSGIISVCDLGSEWDGHTLSHYLPKIFIEPSGEGGQDEVARLHFHFWTWEEGGGTERAARAPKCTQLGEEPLWRRWLWKKMEGQGSKGSGKFNQNLTSGDAVKPRKAGIQEMLVPKNSCLSPNI